MKKNIGLWIDRQKATIIVASEAQEDVSEILSHVERKSLRGVVGLRNHYYKLVIAKIREASSVLIFGPDEAKAELQLLLQQREPGNRTVNVEIGYDMNPRQIMTKVRSYFRLGAVTAPAPLAV